MSPGSADYALLSQDAYKSHQLNDTVTLGGVDYQVIAEVDDPRTGYQGTAYQRVGSNEVVIAHRGTEFDREPFHDGGVDAGMVLTGLNAQTPDAMAFTKQVMEQARSNHPPLEVTVTGHSLGGTLAEITARQYNLHGETFNAYGAAGLWQGVPEGGHQVIDHVRAGDVVSAASAHFGEVRIYAAEQDIATLWHAGYRDDGGVLSVRNPFGAIDFDAHSIDNFVPNSELLGQSIISPESQARYRAHHQMIDRYRGDVMGLREGLSLGWEIPKTAVDIAHVAGEKVEQGVQALERGAQAVEHRAEVLYDKAQESVIEGTHVAEHAVRQAYETTRDAMAEGAHAAGQAVSHGVDAVENAAHEAAARASEAWDSVTHPDSWFQHSSAATQPRVPVSLDQPDHPDHAMYKQALAGMTRIDAGMGRQPDQQTARVAGALVPAAVANGMARIDEVALSDDGTRAFAVQRGLTTQFASIPTGEAVNTSIAQSSAAWQSASQQRASQQQASQQLHSPRELFAQSQHTQGSPNM